MNIHEYQAKEILARYGVPVPQGKLAGSAREAALAAEGFGGAAVVKAQIHAGGRGAAGGVEVAASPDQAASIYERLLGMRLVTRQTGSEGKRVRRVYVEQALRVERELYLSLILDRRSARPQFIASSAGGSGIEDSGDQAFRVEVDPAIGPTAHALRGLALALGLEGALSGGFTRIALAVYRAFRELDCELVEINPLAVAGAGELIALDAKMSFDDNSVPRHQELLSYRDSEEEPPEEYEASKYGLSYVKLEGSIGCLVNGAGLAMATLDALALRGGRAANFLDIGGGADKEAVRRAFGIIFDEGRAKAVLVNVFGGIVRCDTVAAGLSEAIAASDNAPPVVVRLAGNRAEEGRRALRRARSRTGAMADLRYASSMGEAAGLAVSAAAGR